MASFIPQNPPANLNMVSFLATLDRLGSVAKQCRFAARILPAGGPNNILAANGMVQFMNEMTLLIEATELPGRGFDYNETRYYGPSQYFAKNTKYGGSIEMQLICRTEGFERQFFDDWMQIINPVSSFDFNYPKEYYGEIQIFQLAEFGLFPSMPKPIYQWSLHQAWPMLVNPQPVTWADTDVLKLKVQFAYKYWSRPGIDGPQSQSTQQSMFNR